MSRKGTTTLKSLLEYIGNRDVKIQTSDCYNIDSKTKEALIEVLVAHSNKDVNIAQHMYDEVSFSKWGKLLEELDRH